MSQFRQYLNSRALLNLVSLIAILGSIAYLSIGLWLPVRLGIGLVSLALSILIEVRYPLAPTLPERSKPHDWKTLLLILLYGLIAAIGVYLLWQGRSERALITPWGTVSSLLFLSYGLASFILLMIGKRLSPYILAIHYGWTFCVLLLVYAIGYGFDPFIHEASMKAIESFGKIEPLTVYYLGQYSLVAVLHGFFGMTIPFWSKVLVPLLAAITIPFALQRAYTPKASILAAATLLLIFPFSILTLTTPQNLAFLFLILLVLRSLKIETKGDAIVLWLLALAALFTQPIAGIPALILAIACTCSTLVPVPFSKIFNWLLTAAYALALPFAFYFFAPQSETGLVMPNLATLFSSFTLSFPSSEIWWLNFSYLFGTNRLWLFLACVIFGYILARREKLPHYTQRYAVPAVALVISAVLAMTVDFSALIAYERGDYPLRLLVCAAIFTLPFVLRSLSDMYDKISKQPLARRLGLFIFLSLLATASLYLSYPRLDHYFNSRGYATSTADLFAVQWIEKNAAREDYVVLANQQVSAAALRHAGFKKYFPGDIFYYPIPTGGPLYALYLDMIKTPSRETMLKAMDLTGVDRAYFVVDSYWWAADKIIDESSVIADSSQVISNGQVVVFEFRR